MGFNQTSFSQASFDLWGDTPDPPQEVGTLVGNDAGSQDYSPGFVPSSYHWPIFEFGRDPAGGNALLDACPGSGKSTTIIEFARQLPRDKSILIVAFSKHIAEELQPRLLQTGLHQRSHPHTGKRLVEARTIHSLGLNILRNHLTGNRGGSIPLEESKYEKLVNEYIARRGLSRKDYLVPVTELVRLAQLTLTNPQNEAKMKELALHYNLVEAIPYWETVYIAAMDVLKEGKELALERKIINYDDMLWLPDILELRPFERFDWVLIDEYQDLSRAQLELVLNCTAPGGRFLFVGDHNQSIFGFNCAEIGVKKLILQRTGAQEYPLPVTYRCPKSHVALASLVYPGIVAAPGAKEGEVTEIEEEELAREVAAGDLLICRTTAPLISLCFELLRRGIKARVRGRDIGRNLGAIISPLVKAEAAGKYIFNTQNFLSWLEVEEEVRLEQAARAVKAGGPATGEELVRDKFQTLRAIYLAQEERPKTAAEFKKLVQSLFSDTSAVVWLSTIHRAKGLEADRVFFLKPSLVPHPMAKLEWEKVQEMNCRYVALTRAKNSLYFVKDGAKPNKGEQEGL